MGYSIGYCKTHKRDIGYGVPAPCDHPECNEIIDRGMGYACCEGFNHSANCKGYFCEEHRWNYVLQDELEHMSPEELEALGLSADAQALDEDSGIIRCRHTIQPHKEAVVWLEYILNDESWEKFRTKFPERMERFKKLLAEKGDKPYVIVEPDDMSE